MHVAPEFIYDEKTGEYVVYWASTTLEVDGDKNITQEYENHTIYYCKTRDFRTYTDPRYIIPAARIQTASL